MKPPFRRAGFAPIQVEVTARGGGEFLLRHCGSLGAVGVNAVAPLRYWSEAAPERIFLAARGPGQRVWQKISYAQARAQVEILAGALLARGMGQDTPLMLLCENSIEQALMTYAAHLAQVPIVPLSPTQGGILEEVCELIKPCAVFVGATGEETVCGLPKRDVIDMASLLREGGDRQAVAASYAGLCHGTVAKYLLTSGSTGSPKAVVITHGMMCVAAAMGAAVLRSSPGPQVLVSWLPWSHAFGGNAVLHEALVGGATLYVDPGRPREGEFEETLVSLREVAPTVHCDVPVFYTRLVEVLEVDEELARMFFSRVRRLSCGGAALTEEVARRLQAVAVRTTGERICLGAGYGLTETGPTVMTVHWETEEVGLLGLPLPGVEIKLCPVAGGQREVRVRGACVTPGYLGDSKATAAAFDEEGFYKTGDAADFVGVPEEGLAFAGRLRESFKLHSGAWVHGSLVRLQALEAAGGLLREVVVAGPNRPYVAVLGFADEKMCERCGGLAALKDRLRAAFRGRHKPIRRVLVTTEHPQGMTPKGSLNQRVALAHSAALLERLYAREVDDEILEFGDGV